ncbi:MAG: hypothetical protein ACKO0Z_19475 [Betaproteobacteria bacterium]
MERLTQKSWERALDGLMEMEEDRRNHFALLVQNIAHCYIEGNNSAAVVLLRREDEMMIFSAGATEFDTVELIERARKAMNSAIMADAPEKALYN